MFLIIINNSSKHIADIQKSSGLFCRGESLLYSKKNCVSLPSTVTEPEASKVGRKINCLSTLHFWVKKIALLGKIIELQGKSVYFGQYKGHQGRPKCTRGNQWPPGLVIVKISTESIK